VTNLPEIVPTETLVKALELLRVNGIEPSAAMGGLTVRSIVRNMSEFLLCPAHELDTAEIVEAFAEEAVELLRQCASNSSSSSSTVIAAAPPLLPLPSSAVPVPPPPATISADTKRLCELSVSEVCRLVDSLGFPEISAMFAQKGVTGVKLCFCREAANLQTPHFGITEDFIAEGLFEMIKKWKEDGVSGL